MKCARQEERTISFERQIRDLIESVSNATAARETAEESYRKGSAELPGWIDTDLTATARTQIEGLNERVMARTPAKRWGLPDDFAGITIFLASAAFDFVTGTAIP